MQDNTNNSIEAVHLQIKGALSQKEFVAFSKSLIEAIKKVRKEILDISKGQNNALGQNIQTVDNRLSELAKTVKKLVEKPDIDLTPLQNEYRSLVENAVAELKGIIASVPQFDASYLEEQVGVAFEKINGIKGDTPAEVRDKLEVLKGDERLDKSAIRGLEEELAEIRAIKGGGGTSAIGVAAAFKYIAHTEEPVGDIDGNNTTYTVNNNIWWIAGFTLNGEQIAELPNFTYSGKTITFSSAIPAAYSGKDFECKYIGS